MSIEQLRTEIANLATKHNLPMQMLLDVYREHHSEPIAKRVFTDWARKAHLQFDEQLFMAVMEAFRARTAMNQAATEVIQSELTLQEAGWKSSTTPQTWATEAERKEELAQAQHETELARLAAERRRHEGDGRPPAPAAAAPPPAPHPLERFRNQVGHKLGGISRAESTKEVRITIVRSAAEIEIQIARAKGSDELARQIEAERDEMVADIKSDAEP